MEVKGFYVLKYNLLYTENYFCMSKSLPKDLKKKFEVFLKDIDFNKIEEDFENTNAIEAITNFFNKISIMFQRMFQSKEGLIALFEAFKHIILNFEEDLIESNIVDKETFQDVKNYVIDALAKDPLKVKEIYIDYKSALHAKYPIEKLTGSLLFYHDFLPDLIELAQKNTLNDYFDKVEKLFMDKLEKCGENDFDRYIFDWLLKFGYLIEGYLVDILRAELKLYYILNGKSFNNKNIKKMKFSKLLEELDEDHTFSRYRNAIFHPNFIIEYKVNPEERKIIFPSLKADKKELLINNLVNYFFNLIKIVKSYSLAFTYAIPLNMREDDQKQAVEMIESWIKELDTVDFIPK